MNRFRTLSVLACIVAFGIGIGVPIASAAVTATTRVSVDKNGVQASGASLSPSVSADGRYVAFTSSAANLVSSDTNGKTDVFVYDTEDGSVLRASVSSAEAQANGNSSVPSISDNGRYIAFQSDATDLVADDTNEKQDVFVHDTFDGSTTLVSDGLSNTQAGNHSSQPVMSGDGTEVAFNSLAANLVTGDTNSRMDVFVHDMGTGVITRVSVDSNGVEGNGASQDSSMSDDGRYVSFQSQSTNFVAGDTNATDIFVHDRQDGSTERVSEDGTGAAANAGSVNAFISGDGRFVAFESSASNLVANDTNTAGDVFVHDTQDGSIDRANVDSAGTETPARTSANGPSLSDDGRYVAFSSNASNLVPADTNSNFDVFIRDRPAGLTTRISEGDGDVQGNSSSELASIADDGLHTAYHSFASNLVDGDTNGNFDVFISPLPSCPGFQGDPRPQIVGTSNADVLNGTTGTDIICGLEGNDTMRGLGEDDVLVGGDGRDSIEGGNGEDIIFGEEGDDSINGGPSGDRLEGGLGKDTTSYAGSGVGVTVDLRLKPGGFPGQQNDPIGGWATGDSLGGFERVTGTSSPDSLTGNGEANILKGQGGADTLTGNQDADTLQGGSGGDSLIPGGGNDTLDYSDSTAGVVVDISANTVSGGFATGDTITGAAGTAAGFEYVRGSAFVDTLTGNDLVNRLFGNGGADFLHGRGEADVLYGGIGDDDLFGGDGDDRLFGQGDNDDFDGEVGTDRCVQGPGTGTLTNCEM